MLVTVKFPVTNSIRNTSYDRPDSPCLLNSKIPLQCMYCIIVEYNYHLHTLVYMYIHTVNVSKLVNIVSESKTIVWCVSFDNKCVCVQCVQEMND